MKPKIDFSQIFPPEKSVVESEHVFRMVDESLDRTEPIRKRVLEFEKEYDSLYKEYCQARSKFQFFRMRQISKRMDINRDLRETLYKMWQINL